MTASSESLTERRKKKKPKGGGERGGKVCAHRKKWKGQIHQRASFAETFPSVEKANHERACRRNEEGRSINFRDGTFSNHERSFTRSRNARAAKIGLRRKLICGIQKFKESFLLPGPTPYEDTRSQTFKKKSGPDRRGTYS